MLVESMPALPVQQPKQSSSYRNFVDSHNADRVAKTYKLNHTLQNYESVKKMREEHLKFNKGKMSIWEAISKLDDLVDESDPDADFPQIYHALQTAESLRKAYPDKDWLHLIGLIHDLGKILALPEYGGLPQWAVVGDTFPVGCQFSGKICYSHFFAENPDFQNEQYSTLFGIYSPNCGFDNVLFSWGHDEYLYQVLRNNNCSIPKIGLKIIRYHSFYPWHKDGAYYHLMADEDSEALPFIKCLSTSDLYSKVPELPNVEELKPYYEGLIAKYFSNPIIEW